MLWTCARVAADCLPTSWLLLSPIFDRVQSVIGHAVLGNTGTLISFRVGPEDAAILTKEFQPKFEVEVMLNIANHSIYLKLMIDRVPSISFSARLRGAG